jgi:hypothetical protein
MEDRRLKKKKVINDETESDRINRKFKNKDESTKGRYSTKGHVGDKCIPDMNQ